MFKTIVVASDGSQEALAGARFAFSLAAACQAEVTLVHVVDTPAWLLVHPQVMPDLERLQRDAARRAHDDLERLAADAPDAVSVTCKVVRGTPAAQLLKLIDDRHADLAMLGTHGVGARRGAIGSVSHQVMQHAPCSVLLFRGDVAPRGGRVTVVAAVDGSEHSLRSLDEAQSLAAALGGSLRLVHVVDPYIPTVGKLPGSALRQLREHGAGIVHGARARVVAPIDEVVEDVREGSPDQELVQACVETLPAIAVVGTRGLHGFRGLLMGSTARELVNHAPCPVLVSRPTAVRADDGARDVSQKTVEITPKAG